MRNLLGADSDERVFFKDRESRFVLVSAGFASALAPGLTPAELVGKTDFDLFSLPHATQAYEDEQRIMLTGEPVLAKIERETFHDRPDVWVSTTKLPLLDAEGQIIGTWGFSRDVTAQVSAERELAHQALHDSLTGLPNRALAMDRARQLLASARRMHTPVAALYIDIDGFKNINDTFGHGAGDELLEMAAERIRLTIRETDTAARLGGDEFVVLLDAATLDVGAELVAERLIQVLREPYKLGGRELRVTASVGMATGYREHPEELLRDADIALYEAKAQGRDRYVVFQAAMQTVARDRVMLEMDLREALEDEQFFLAYQPTIDLASGSVTGVEALIRWQHPTRGELPPSAFIPLAEKGGLIVAIGRWVLREACREAADWNAAGHEIGVAVNVSSRQLDDDQLIDDVRRALDDSGLPPELLTLEVTETALMRDVGVSAARLRVLKSLGVQIAIDDFGTGYSSLAYLQQLPVDVLKIDRSFVHAATTSHNSAALISTLVHLSANLHLTTVAEGIESTDELAIARREHCDHGQGYLFSRPIGADALRAVLDGIERKQEGAREYDAHASGKR